MRKGIKMELEYDAHWVMILKSIPKISNGMKVISWIFAIVHVEI